MKPPTKVHLVFGGAGLLLGFVLGQIGFSDYGELYRMFTFSDLRMLLAFAAAVGLSFLVFLLIDRRLLLPTRKINPGTVPGGILFGLGWVLCGACPAVSLIQIGEGRLPALASLLGMLLGAAFYQRVHRRFFRWDTGSCDSSEH